MKLLISILLLLALFLSYYAVNSIIENDVMTQGSNFSFSDSDSAVRPLKEVAAYQDISNIPLFDLNRKPEVKIVEKPVVARKPVQKQLKVQALGIAVAGEKLLAVVKNLNTGEILRLQVNGDIDGWILTSVSADSFVFTKDENEKIVKFKNGD